MSQYHDKCTKDETAEQSKDQKAKPPPSRMLTTKPFCDCQDCACRNCPDILKLLYITVTETSCVFGSKVAKEPCCSDQGMQPENKSVLSKSDQKTNCTCEIVARAVRSDVHMNVGLTEKRDTMFDHKDSKEPSTTNIVPKE